MDDKQSEDEESVGAEFFTGLSPLKNLLPPSLGPRIPHQFFVNRRRVLPLIHETQSGISPLQPTSHQFPKGSCSVTFNSNIPPFVPLGANLACSLPQTMPTPDGSGNLRYPTPNPALFSFDPATGYRFDNSTGLHYNANSGLFINSRLNISLRWEPLEQTYLRVDIPVGPSLPCLVLQDALSNESTYSATSSSRRWDKPRCVETSEKGIEFQILSGSKKNGVSEGTAKSPQQRGDTTSDESVKEGITCQDNPPHDEDVKKGISFQILKKNFNLVPSSSTQRWDKSLNAAKDESVERERSSSRETHRTSSRSPHDDKRSTTQMRRSQRISSSDEKRRKSRERQMLRSRSRSSEGEERRGSRERLMPRSRSRSSEGEEWRRSHERQMGRSGSRSHDEGRRRSRDRQIRRSRSRTLHNEKRRNSRERRMGRSRTRSHGPQERRRSRERLIRRSRSRTLHDEKRRNSRERRMGRSGSRSHSKERRRSRKRRTSGSSSSEDYIQSGTHERQKRKAVHSCRSKSKSSSIVGRHETRNIESRRPAQQSDERLISRAVKDTKLAKPRRKCPRRRLKKASSCEAAPSPNNTLQGHEAQEVIPNCDSSKSALLPQTSPINEPSNISQSPLSLACPSNAPEGTSDNESSKSLDASSTSPEVGANVEATYDDLMKGLDVLLGEDDGDD